MSKWNTLLVAEDGGICTISLNRPDNMNAYTVEMCEELEQVFAEVSANDAVRAVIVTGTGRAFCAGMDLSAKGNVFGLDENARPQGPEDYELVRDTGGRAALAIYRCTKPVIGAINGAAIGIGSTMLLPMDIRLASEKARFGFVFSRLGIVNEACSSWFLPRVVGLPQAMEWLIRGDIFAAEEALQGGLVREVCPPDELLPRAMAIAGEIASRTSPLSVALIRQMVYSQAGAPSPLSAHKLESVNMFYTSTRDGKEGVQAFLEKRDPCYVSQVSRDLPRYYPWDETG